MAAENSISLEFYYGGKFILVPKSVYEGGCIEQVEGIGTKQFNMKYLNSLADKVRIKKQRRFFVLPEKGFMVMYDDNSVQQYVKKHVIRRGYKAYIYVEGEIDETDDFDTILSNIDLERLVENTIVSQETHGDRACGGITIGCNYGDDMSEDYVVCNSDDDFSSECNSDLECEQPINKITRGKKHSHLEYYDPKFEVDMTFATRKDLRKAIHEHATKTMRNIKLEHCEKVRVTAKCKMERCFWHIHARSIPDEHTYKIVDYNPEHECCSTFSVSNLKSSMLVESCLSYFKSDPDRNVETLRKDLVNQLGVQISWYQVNRAKKAALEILHGNPSDQYKLLFNYREELLRSNPGSTVILEADDSTGESIFWSFYVCFGGLKEGFVSGCRKIIGLDGTHLSGPHGGILLTAVGQDPNDKPYPLAYAVVGTESAITWSWFLSILKEDLHIVPNEFTFISDRQKGLIKACSEVFNGADHRFCIRHMWKNMVSAGLKGEAYKEKLFQASNATSLDTYNVAMKEMSELDPKAVEWLADKPPAQWSKSHFSTKACSDLTLNNICETINKALVPARLKSILVMLEWIREWFTERLQKGRDKAHHKWKGIICPTAKKILEYNMEKVKFCKALKVNEFHFQITMNRFQYNVNFEDHTCSCRRWQLVGIPCSHTLCAIGHLRRQPVDYVHAYYHVETYKNVYAPAIFGINGRGLWPETNFIPPLPPNFGRKAGRPQHLRRRAADEPQKKVKNASKTGPKNPTRSRRIQSTVKCRFCNLPGHNYKGCQLRKAQEIEKKRVEDLQRDLNISQDFVDAFSHVLDDEVEPHEEADPFAYLNIDPIPTEVEPHANQLGDLSINPFSITKPSPSLNILENTISRTGLMSKLPVVRNSNAAVVGVQISNNPSQNSHVKKTSKTPNIQSQNPQSSVCIRGPSSSEQVGITKEPNGPGVLWGGKRYVQVSELHQVLNKKQRKN